MTENEPTKNIKTVWHRLALYLVILFPLVILSAVMFQLTSLDEQSRWEDHNIMMQGIILQNADRNIKVFFKRILSDMDVLLNNAQFQNYIEGLPEENIVEHTALEEEFLALLDARQVYNQIRFIGVSGMEQIRVDYNHGSSMVIPTDELQNKSDRYYFTESINLNADQVYFSPLDLNVEEAEIEVPYNPVIRLSAPVFTENGERKGILVMNVFGKSIFDAAESYSAIMNGSEFMLINNEGYWLESVTDEEEWGWMFDDKKDVTFANKYPEVWEVMQNSENGNIQTKDGLFSYATINPISTVSLKWWAVSLLPNDYLLNERKELRSDNLSLTILLCIAYAIFAGLITYSFTRES
ncbi:MAG: hypothetical protein Q8P30_00580 [Candidatus Uhrbacteria bacterium]|nr:hypothetical protein [Candidatus Uhrbacteria bacterium]